MGRATRYFLIFLIVVIVGTVGFVTVYQDAGFSKIAFAPDRRRMPLTFVTLERYVDQHQHEAHHTMWAHRSDIVDTYRSLTVFDGSAWLSSDGNDAEVWDHIIIEAFPTTAAFVNAVTGPEYASLAETYEVQGNAEYAQFVGHAALQETFDEPVVLVMSDATKEHQRALLDTVVETIVPFDGQIGFAMPTEKIDGNSDRSVRYFALLEFAEPEQMMAWLANTIRRSQFALLRRHVGNLSLVVATPS